MNAPVINPALWGEIAQPDSNKVAIARRIEQSPELLTKLLAGLDSDQARVRFGCLKVLVLASEQYPALVYPHLDFFVRLLDHNNNIFKWGAISIIANLAIADSENRFAAIFAKYFAPITGPVMITAANVIVGGARIGRAKPQWVEPITREILKVAKAKYATDECRNVAIGHAIKALDALYEPSERPAPVLKFVRAQLQNSRPATRNKAEQFLRKGDRSAKRTVGSLA